MHTKKAVLHASRVALATSQSEKLRALQAAVLNTARGVDIDATNRVMFIRTVEDFSEAHLTLLSVFDNPPAALKRAGGSLGGVSRAGLIRLVRATLPELASDDGLAGQIEVELKARGLTTGTDLQFMMTVEGLLERRTTERGRLLLTFIREEA